MNPLSRLYRELAQLRACLNPRDFRRYLACLLSNSVRIAQRRTLAPADLAMAGNVSVAVGGSCIVIPLDEMRTLLFSYDETPTFGGVRELYAGNVYLRAFRPGLQARVVLDLGSNRGMFLMLASQLLNAELAIGVEPQAFYDRAFEALRDANESRCRFVRIAKRAAAMGGGDEVSIRAILDQYAISSVGFLKCDIEGGEFDVFLDRNEFLRDTENIAMELHAEKGDVLRLVDALQTAGFSVVVTDQFGRRVEPTRGHYLYASCSGALAILP
jgi:hypothetical protein